MNYIEIKIIKNFRARMKRWVSLFITEIKLQNFQIPQEVLDKALYLFSNLDDYEMQMEKSLKEMQKQIFLTNYYYYQICFLQYVWQINVYNHYSNMYVKNNHENSTKIENVPKKMRINALDYFPERHAIQ